MCAFFPIGFLFGHRDGVGAIRFGEKRQAARQARDIPVFGGAGNLNSLLGRKNSLFARVGNFSGTASNCWAFRDGFSELPEMREIPCIFPCWQGIRPRSMPL